MDSPYVTSGIITIITTMATVIAFLYRRTDSLQEKINDLVQLKLSCETRLVLLEAETFRLAAERDYQLTQVDPDRAYIVVNANTGLISKWSIEAAVLTHWRARDIIDKSIILLIPDENVAEFQSYWSKWKSENRPPRRGPFEVHIKTKERDKIPIYAFLSAWMDDNKYCIGFMFRLRFVESHE